jgi:glycosyltransferase involved in cell wall biosynthesis
LEGAPPDRIKVQPPGLDTEVFHPTERDPALLRKFDCKNSDLIFLLVARLVSQKGLYDLLFAFKRLVERTKQQASTKLLIGGSGPEETRLKEMIQQLGLQSNVRLIGSVPYRSMPAIHNIADVFVLPSQPTPIWQEQFGYVLLESMACGKPVISTMTGSIPEVVGDAGILVPPADFVQLSDSLEQVAASSDLRKTLGTRGRNRACNHYDVRMITRQLGAHYNTLLRNG